MNATTTRAFTPARIVALVLIGLAVFGLAYLRLAPDASVSVPNGAQAGDLTLESCTYATEDGSYAADCGTLVVPENRANPQSQLIALPVTRIHAKSDHAAEPLFRLCQSRLTDEGVDLDGYTVTQRVDDLEAARVALGYGPVDLVSESAGTRYAMVYAWRYPESIHRSVMIPVNPPGNFVWDAKTTYEQIRRNAALCAKDESCAERTDLVASLRRTDIPDRWLFLPVKDGNG